MRTRRVGIALLVAGLATVFGFTQTNPASNKGTHTQIKLELNWGVKLGTHTFQLRCASPNLPNSRHL